VIVVGEAPAGEPGVQAWAALMAAASPEYVIAATDPESMACCTSPAAPPARPKGAIHVHRAVVAHFATGRYALDLHDDDVFWCTADPGWVTGTSYGIIAPLVHGVTSVVDEAEFDAETLVRACSQRERVSVWYTAPTAIRMMMKLGAERAARARPVGLRFMASVGEPLNPEAVVWGRGLRAAVPRQLVADRDRRHHDRQHRRRWTSSPARWASRCRASRPPSCGAREGGGVRSSRPGVEGELALRRRLAVDDARLPRRGRALPQVLRRRLVPHRRPGAARRRRLLLVRRPRRRRHQVGRPPDRPLRGGERADGAPGGGRGRRDRQARSGVGEIVKAFVALKPGFEPSEALRRELLGHARKRLGAAVAPKEIEFRANLPRRAAARSCGAC
jgi:acetyl-CoA synthetase